MKKEYKNFGRVKISPYIYYVIMRKDKYKMKNEMKKFEDYKKDCMIMVHDVYETEDLQEGGSFHEEWEEIVGATNLHELTDVLIYSEFADHETREWAFQNVQFS